MVFPLPFDLMLSLAGLAKVANKELGLRLFNLPPGRTDARVTVFGLQWAFAAPPTIHTDTRQLVTMTLSQEQTASLGHAVQDYKFPPHIYDFTKNISDHKSSIATVEAKIKADLTSDDWQRVMDGLSNVLYWGWAQKPKIRDVRVELFRTTATESQLRKSAQLFKRCPPPSLLEIKQLKLPQFSGVSFVSKVRMFLDPENSATFDKQIMKIRGAFPETIRATFQAFENSTQIRITKESSDAYEYWCGKMREVSERYFNGRLRAVDVERGFFQLIQAGKDSIAADILKST